MITEIIVAIITGGISLVGIIISNNRGNAKIHAELEKNQAVTDCKIEELTREVREHNNYAKRMPVVEKEIEVLNHRMKNVENSMKE